MRCVGWRADSRSTVVQRRWNRLERRDLSRAKIILRFIKPDGGEIFTGEGTFYRLTRKSCSSTGRRYKLFFSSAASSLRSLASAYGYALSRHSMAFSANSCNMMALSDGRSSSRMRSLPGQASLQLGLQYSPLNEELLKRAAAPPAVSCAAPPSSAGCCVSGIRSRQP
jgi:hypothetical protein